MKQSKKSLLKSMVLSALMVTSVATVAQADDVSVGDTAYASNNGVAIGNTAVAKDSGIAIGNDVYTGIKDDPYSNERPENISIGNRVQSVYGAANHGIGIGSDVTYGMNAVAIGNGTTAVSTDSIAIGTNAKANAKAGDQGIAIGANSVSGKVGTSLGISAQSDFYGVALGNGATAINNYTVALGSGSKATRGALLSTNVTSVTTASSMSDSSKVYADDNAVDTDKKVIANTVKGRYGAVSVGNATATRQITNVAAGSMATDAVNVAQLKSVDNRLTAVNTELSGRIDSLGNRVGSVEDQINNIQTAGSNNSTEINNIKQEVSNQGQTIADHTNQINDLDGRVTNNTNAITDLNDRMNNQDSALTGLNSRVDRLGGEINKVGAGAAALAGLHPLDFEDDSKLTFAAGFGSYKNEQAAALGAFYRPNENIMFSFATAVGNSDNMYNAGLSFRFGESSPYQGLSKAQLVSELEKQGKDIESLKAKANEVDTVKAENAALNERLAKLEALIANR